jgi:hypothetical protein
MDSNQQKKGIYDNPYPDFYSPDQQGEEFMNSEREKVTFPVNEMSEAVYGGKKYKEGRVTC